MNEQLYFDFAYSLSPIKEKFFKTQKGKEMMRKREEMILRFRINFEFIGKCAKIVVRKRKNLQFEERVMVYMNNCEIQELFQ